MKVEHHGPGATAASDGPSRLGETPPGSRPSGPAPVGDQVTLSSDVQAMQAAFEQAAAQPEVRDDVVARMRALLDSGELGQDADTLADAIIDRWLTTP